MPSENMKADIHHFYPCPTTGAVSYDEDGDPYLGFYFQLVDLNGIALSHLMGPYSSSTEAEEACQWAWENNDY